MSPARKCKELHLIRLTKFQIDWVRRLAANVSENTAISEPEGAERDARVQGEETEHGFNFEGLCQALEQAGWTKDGF